MIHTGLDELWHIAHLLLASPTEDPEDLTALGIGPPSQRRGEGFARRWAREGATGARET